MNENRKPLYWTDTDYVDAIAKLKAIANTSVKVIGYDNTSSGNKSTECNHGLCDESIEEIASGVYKQKQHKCPLDMRREGQNSGCFYYCRYFQAGKKTYRDYPDVKTLIKDFKM